jgi:hypothetical protein
MTLNDSGYLGIGTAPLDKLHVDNGTVRISGTTAQAIYVYGAPTIKPYITLNEYGVTNFYVGAGSTTSGVLSLNGSVASETGLHIKASNGNVGIGTSTPTQNLSVYAASPIVDIVATTGTSFSALEVKNTAGSFYIGRDTTAGGFFGLANASVLWSSGTNPIAFFSNNAQRMTIDPNGLVLIRATTQISSPSHQLSVSHDGNNYYGVALWSTASGGTQQISFFNSAGTQQGYISTTGTGTTAYITSSDYRLKENITPMTGALAKVAQLNPVTYTWKEDGSAGQGFVAHELAEVVPDCVDGEKDAVYKDGKPKYQGVDTSFLVATLTKAIQEQQAQIEQQNTLIESLTARLVAVESR